MHYLGGQDFGFGQVFGVFQAFILEPEDVQVRLVAGGKGVVVEGLEAFRLLALAAVGGVEAGDKVLQVGKLQRACLEREVDVGPEVVNP